MDMLIVPFIDTGRSTYQVRTLSNAKQEVESLSMPLHTAAPAHFSTSTS
jgi:hypothetical protein